MTTTQIKSAAKNNSFTNVNSVIINSGLELVNVTNRPYLMEWDVKNNTEIYRITNTIKDLATGKAQVSFGWRS